MTAIVASGMSKDFGTLKAVDSVSFSVAPGEIFGYLGPNGAGKTTSIRMLTGMTRPTRGQLAVGGLDVRLHPHQVKRIAGVVPDKSNLYDELTCLDNLVFLGRLYGVDRPVARAEQLLELFSLSDRSRTRFARLSRGLKRRLTLAAALIHRPQVLFLDEPTSGLDVMSARALRQLISGLAADGTTVFLTTHNIEEAGGLCERIAVIVAGRIVAIDTPQGLTALAGQKPGLVLTTAVATPRDALLPHPSLKGVELDQNTITIRTADLRQALRHVLDCLEAAEIEVMEIDTRQASLEDAFVTITGLSQVEMAAPAAGDKNA